ncbi:MAG: hypothetical protein V4667_04605 [Bacteroidota bacterium]
MKNFFLTLFFVLTTFVSFSQTNPTDACGAGAQSLPVGTVGSCTANGYTLPGSYSNGGAVNASCAGGYGSDADDGWYSFTAGSTSTTIDLRGDRNMVAAIYTGSCGTGEVTCMTLDANTNGTLTFPTTNGTTYYLQIHRRSGNNTASMSGNICIYQSYPPFQCSATAVTFETGPFTSACAGTAQNITTDMDAREYVTVNVDAGQPYTFTATGSNTFLYVTSSDGTTQYVQSGSPLVWTSAFTGTIRVYLFGSSTCGLGGGGGVTNRTLAVTCGTAAPTGNVNCSARTPICSDNNFSGNNSGYGTQELTASNQGCLGSTEHQSSWYSFNALTSGTVSFDIETAIDYDFAIWGPNKTCGSLGAPIRCSFSGLYGNTGLGSGATDLSDGDYTGANGELDAWVAPLTVTAGQSYIMLIDNFTANSTSFTIDWTMSGGSAATLNCTPLSVDDFVLKGKSYQGFNKLEWDFDVSSVSIEKSTDGVNFVTVKSTDSNNFVDENPSSLTYYRLSAFHGKSNLVSLINDDNFTYKVLKITSITGQEVSSDYQGVKLYFYEDGTVTKKIN